VEEIRPVQKLLAECPNQHVVWLVKTGVEKQVLRLHCPHCGTAMKIK